MDYNRRDLIYTTRHIFLLKLHLFHSEDTSLGVLPFLARWVLSTDIRVWQIDSNISVDAECQHRRPVNKHVRLFINTDVHDLPLSRGKNAKSRGLLTVRIKQQVLSIEKGKMHWSRWQTIGKSPYNFSTLPTTELGRL